ncbi:hypothetical protein BJ165DRAFT_884467 [Panaeolus papilionaceus]|nr:hypothetical protein BJ165DRAFT_884467 [Panaeolus papilionaceus]
MPWMSLMRRIADIELEVAACSLFFWDYLITLHLEVDLVWKSGNSYLKYFYIFQRYLPFIDSIILRLHNSLTKGISTNECRVTVVIQWREFHRLHSIPDLSF